MKNIILLCAILALISLSLATPPQDIQDWRLVGKPASGHEVKLTFAIKQHNPGWLKEKIKAVSYPDSPEYTNYMNFDEIANYVYGEPESVRVVTKTLESMEARKINYTLGNDFIVAFVPYEHIEEKFDAEFYQFVDSKDGSTITTSLHYTIPAYLQEHIDFVSGVSLVKTTKHRGPLRSSPWQYPQIQVTPTYLDKEYNISGYVSTNPQNSQAVAAFLKQYFDASDLKKFQTKFNLPVRPITKVVGKDIPKDPGIEANLDVEYISATGRNVSTWFVSISTYSNNGQEDFLSWMVDQVNTTDSPWVHSVSYGDDEDSISKDYLSRVDTEFMKFGVSGRTVLFASGDSGVECNGANEFTPNWPTSSPFITSVGGTISLDTVWTSGGGGFSNFFPMPDYQKNAVQAYLNSGNAPPKYQFNESGRAYPDVSAFSVNYIFIEYGVEAPVSGTSCSTPTVAGIISILNDIRLNKGLKTLGFLNPLLYGPLQGNGFFDIVYGDNGNDVCKGFEATKGWDPASGWGSPNFGVLKALI